MCVCESIFNVLNCISIFQQMFIFFYFLSMLKGKSENETTNEKIKSENIISKPEM